MNLGTNERTDFPVPKVKTENRQIDVGDLTRQQKSIWITLLHELRH